MSDPSPEAPPAPDSQIGDEIGRAVGMIWQRRGGVRPKLVSTEVSGDVIRCVIEEGVADEDGTGDEAAGDGRPVSESNAYRQEATAAVARITRRTVSAFIAKRDAKSHVATQTFILERLRVKH
jgi:hypothetical protein